MCINSFIGKINYCPMWCKQKLVTCEYGIVWKAVYTFKLLPNKTIPYTVKYRWRVFAIRSHINSTNIVMPAVTMAITSNCKISTSSHHYQLTHYSEHLDTVQAIYSVWNTVTTEAKSSLRIYGQFYSVKRYSHGYVKKWTISIHDKQLTYLLFKVIYHLDQHHLGNKIEVQWWTALVYTQWKITCGWLTIVLYLIRCI